MLPCSSAPRLAAASVLLLTAVCFAQPTVLTPSPIIGILTVPIAQNEVCDVTLRSAAFRGLQSASASGCFESAYPRWLEAAGARTVFIPWNADDATLDELLHSVNGVLFTGGGLNLTFANPYLLTAQKIWNAAQAFNAAGDVFPLHGTCMGMQMMCILAANNASVLDTYAFDSEDESLALNFTADGLANSRIFGPSAPQDIVHVLATENVTENLHHDGVPPSMFAANAALGSTLRVVSTNRDREGKPFASTVEAFDAPFTGTQWHPERPQFNFASTLGIAHSYDAVHSMQYVANFFVNEARFSGHVFANITLLNALTLYDKLAVPVGPIMDGYGAYSLSWP